MLGQEARAEEILSKSTLNIRFSKDFFFYVCGFVICCKNW